jgi:hypothetical protein
MVECVIDCVTYAMADIMRQMPHVTMPDVVPMQTGGKTGQYP